MPKSALNLLKFKLPNVRELVLSCIDADLCKQILLNRTKYALETLDEIYKF